MCEDIKQHVLWYVLQLISLSILYLFLSDDFVPFKVDFVVHLVPISVEWF